MSERFRAIAPTRDHLAMFERSLWKEQRRLEVATDDGSRRLRKHFGDPATLALEVEYVSLVNGVEEATGPTVLAVGDSFVEFAYVEGTRVHNVFGILKGLERHDRAARPARMRLIERCAAGCAAVQRVMVEHHRRNQRRTNVYPVRHKLMSLLDLFNHCLALDLDLAELDREVERAECCLRDMGTLVPFRDAAPKNLILDWPETWRGRVSAERQQEVIEEALAARRSDRASPLDTAPIVQVDFASCGETTVPEDDPISLHIHESSWLGSYPDVPDLLWNDDAPDLGRLAIGLTVRLYRLGGRRLAYLLAHKNGYRARYDTESAAFYFRALVGAAEHLCPDLVRSFPTVLLATLAILNRLDQGILVERDWFEEVYGSHPHRYYRDVFPY